MRSDDVLRLLVIELSLEDAEHQLSTLRNAGIAVRPSTAEDEDELDAVLERQPLDLILINSEHQLGVAKVSDAVIRSGKDVPVIVLLDDYSIENAVAAFKAGAVDAVDSESYDHVEAVIRREVTNLSQRRRARMLESSLRETEKRCHALLDSSRDAIAYVHEGMHVYANPAYLALFDYDEFDELEGLPILDMVAGEDAGRLKEVLREISKGTSAPDDVDVKISIPDGKTKAVAIEFSPASIDGEPCTQIVLRDKAMDPELAQELRDLKTTDLVTGLHNRQSFIKSLEAAISQVVSDNANHSVLYCEIDNFKSVLEQVGLAGVDLILGDIAKVISQELSDKDIAGRLGDNVFAIVCQGRTPEAAQKLGDAVRGAVESHISEVGGNSVTMSLSIGVTRVLESITKAQELLSYAAAGAREAAEQGGNRVYLYDLAKQKAKGEDDSVHWIERIKEALKTDKLTLVYQPIVSLHGAEETLYEALVRLVDEDGNEIPAGQFMPAIAGHDVMIKVDQWVIQNACIAIEKGREEAPDKKILIFLKLSTQTLNRPEVLPWLAKVIQKYRVPGDSLVFEAPESKLLTNLKPARQFVKGLKQLHCRFAIEQFGSGLNSFQILKHLPADYLKIDRAFMKDLPKKEENQERVKQISDQAHGMGKVTIAEFVEDASSMSILWQCGVNFVQGNFLQEPEKVLGYE